MRWAFRYIRWGDSIADSGHLAVVTGLKLVQGWNQTFKGLISLLYQLHANPICICKRQTALSSVNVNSKSSVTINRQLDRVCLLQSSLVEIAHLLSISVLASCPTRAQLTWQPSVHFCASRHQVSGYHSLTEDLQRQKPIICGPLQMLTMLAQMIVTVSAHGQS